MEDKSYNKEIKDSLKIREANPQDIHEILSLYASINDEGETIDINEALSLFEKMKSYPYHKVFVVEKNERVLATFALTIIDYMAHGGKKVGILEDLVVEERHRRKGIGTEILKFAISECRKNGCYKLALSSNLRREKAHRFYEKNGFKLHGYSFYTTL
ncbi:MAG: GNAT family N-acetyltransferase [Deltaproteobacteria bacterium]|nr:GNAT family N-acetyltransferase [Deltaproteobacteria bacterium]